jgi:peptidoglycan/LPS O-acetylase OafA/YrhL
MPHLSLGVILFFSLSGFLLCRPFAAAVVRGVHGPGVRTYLRNRALRILPAYRVILLVTGVALGAALLRDASSALVVGSLVGQPLTLLKDVALVQSYDPWTLLTGIGPAWSLVIEVAFYVTLPLVAALAAVVAGGAATRRRRRLIALLPPAALLVLGLLGKVAVHLLQVRSGMGDGWGADWYSVLARSYLANAGLFAFAMALGVLHTDIQDGLVRLPRWWRHAAVAGAGAVVVATLYLTSNRTGIGDAKYDLLMAIPCGVLLAIVVLPDAGSSHRLLSLLDSRPLVAVGLASYSLFLWHGPLVHWLREHGSPSTGRAALSSTSLCSGRSLGWRLSCVRIDVPMGRGACDGTSAPAEANRRFRRAGAGCTLSQHDSLGVVTNDRRRRVPAKVVQHRPLRN